MIELGKTLRSAREAKGLTASQLSEITRIAPMTLQELEEENFAHIAAPIYGRGFIKLYCAAVEIDPKPLIEAFMELYAKSRGETPAAKPPAKTEPPTDPVQPEAATAPEPPVKRFGATARPAAAPAPQTEDLFSAPQPAAPKPSAPAPAEPEATAPSLSRYAAPVRQTSAAANPAAMLRLAVLAVAAFAALALIVFAIRAVYRATARPGTADPETEAVAPAAETAPAANSAPVAEVSKPETPASAEPEAVTVRTPQSIPDLYVD